MNIYQTYLESDKQYPKYSMHLGKIWRGHTFPWSVQPSQNSRHLFQKHFLCKLIVYLFYMLLYDIFTVLCIFYNAIICIYFVKGFEAFRIFKRAIINLLLLL